MIRREWNCLLPGVLVQEWDREGAPVFINSRGIVQFSVRPIADPPKGLADVQYYTWWGDKLPGFVDDPVADDAERVRAVREFLSGKAILFKPTVHVGASGPARHLAAPVAVVPLPAAIDEDSSLVPILYLPDTDPADFETELMRGLLGPYGDAFPGDMPVPAPAAVWVKDHLYGPFRSMALLPGGWKLTGDGVRKLRFDLDEFTSLVLPFGKILFIEADTFSQAFLRRLEQEGTPLAEPVSEAPRPARASSAGGPRPRTPEELEERRFLERLMHIAQARRLLYHEEDLLNFHTALKTGSLVLLAGMSGTGKSQLVQVYAEALGLAEGQFRIIPVRPTWTDGSDLLGFLDLTHNVYRPADTGLVELLVDAERNPDKLFLVCFDEMNLARVEHYFAHFLSVLELDVDRRVITLYSPDQEATVLNAARIPPRVRIGPNVMFAGTVNVDESTYAFSDKVLDRAQVIEPRVLDFTRLPEYLRRPLPPLERREVTFAAYNAWRAGSDDLELTDAELEYLEKVRGELQKVDRQRGIGYRTLRHIDLYLKNIPFGNDGEPAIPRPVAFDWQMVQKVFTKLRGPREQLEELVGVMDDAGAVSGSRLLELMDKYQDVSGFARSRAVILHKARELKLYGFAS